MHTACLLAQGQPYMLFRHFNNVICYFILFHRVQSMHLHDSELQLCIFTPFVIEKLELVPFIFDIIIWFIFYHSSQVARQMLHAGGRQRGVLVYHKWPRKSAGFGWYPGERKVGGKGGLRLWLHQLCCRSWKCLAVSLPLLREWRRYAWQLYQPMLPVHSCYPLLGYRTEEEIKQRKKNRKKETYTICVLSQQRIPFF